ncbi:MAG: BadF/BadG/BcrA/BcrD ATPase family protein [Clostridia bacterium]|nr:BadF/BadG/BcrA/BcrD ATPase family protein [Clostridia bacterium]
MLVENKLHKTLTELANATGTSDATAIRLANTSGYSGYQELKIALARESASPDRSIHDDIEPDHTLLVAVKDALVDAKQRGTSQDSGEQVDEQTAAERTVVGWMAGTAGRLGDNRMDLVVGVDGGGTKTACLVADMGGSLLGLGFVGPSNYLRLAGGAREAAQAVRHGVEAAMRDAGLDISAPGCRIRVAQLALGGVGTDGVNVAMTEAARAVLDAECVCVENDAAAGLAAAVGELYGVVIVAGTGSIAMAVDREGRRARSGGWGYRVGDEGSGQDIGRLGLAAATRAHDGRGPATSLVGRALARYGIDTLDGLRGVPYREPVNNRDIVDFCLDVVAAAHEGDSVALGITEYAGRELAVTAYAAARVLGMDAGEFPAALCGSVFKAGNVILGPFRGELAKLAPGARVVQAPYPPVVGAVILALLRASVECDGTIRCRLAESWKEVERRHE